MNKYIKQALGVSFFLGLQAPMWGAESVSDPIQTLSLEERLDIYDSKKRDFVYTLGTSFYPLGMGLYSEGDLLGGTLVVASDSVGLAATGLFLNELSSYQPGSNAYPAILYAGIATLGFALGRVLGLVFIPPHNAAYNLQLRKDLHLLDASSSSNLLFSFSTQF